MNETAIHSTQMTPPPFVGAMLLVLITVIAVAAVRLAHAPTAVPESDARVIVQRDLRFEDMPGGAIDVIDVHHPERSQVLAPGAQTDGFLRATVRALARERKRQGGNDETPFRLSALADGRLLLEDLATGHRVDLEAFGHTNAGRFAELLRSGMPAAPPQR